MVGGKIIKILFVHAVMTALLMCMFTQQAQTNQQPSDSGEVFETTATHGVELNALEETNTQSKFSSMVLWCGVGSLGVIIVLYAVLFLKRRHAEVITAHEIKVVVPSVIRAANIQGIGNRENQEDSFGITDVTDTSSGVFAVIADGIGGGDYGAEISHIVTSSMIAIFKAVENTDDPATLLLRMVSKAQENVCAFIAQQGCANSGSTVVAVIVKNGGLFFLSVGDSRAYLLRGGALVQLNREHTFASELDEKAARGEISLQDARSDTQRNSLTSYIGVKDRFKTDSNVKAIPLVVGDRVLLMTDGIFGTLSDLELTELASLPDLYEAGSRIERTIIAKQKLNQDNFTAILLAI